MLLLNFILVHCSAYNHQMANSHPDWPILMQCCFRFTSLDGWFVVVDDFVGWIGGCRIELSSCFRFRWRCRPASWNRYGRQWILPFPVPPGPWIWLRLWLPVESALRCGIWCSARRFPGSPPRRHPTTPIFLSQMSQCPLTWMDKKEWQFFRFEIHRRLPHPFYYTIFIPSHSLFALFWNGIP